jgi:hypothetical protein
MTRTYQRSQVLSFDDLNATQQAIASQQLDEQAEETSYVLWKDEPLPLSMFERISNRFFSGCYATSYFDGYMIRFNEEATEATVVHFYN